jgi:DNA invertase Pin-like site-specific DNA recombinase
MNSPDAKHPNRSAGTAERPAEPVALPHPAPEPQSFKIHGRHRDRLAVVYVRQSTPQQVLEHRESTARQYALADRAVALGWPRERVLVIDDDQGRSGRTADHRAGFQRLLAELTMSHVGLVLGLEMSRLARSNKDWHHLQEVCAVFDALLADQDGVYDPADPNDRLLLGLRGIISEVELHTMYNRLERGKLHKAGRGELHVAVPVGYVKTPAEEVAFEPDEQARAVVQLVFDKFEELGQARAVFRYLLRHDIRLGMRVRKGPERGRLAWRRPSYAELLFILHHPIYAGAYVYGRRPTDRKRAATGQPHGGKRWVPLTETRVVLRDHLPAYITWERFLANQERLKRNSSRPATPGVPRKGPALLAGLVACGACGRRLRVGYGHSSEPYYRCVRHLMEGRPPTCRGLAARAIDDLVAAQVLRALEPAALEVSLSAIDDILAERAQLDRHWQQRLERARYEAARAERQYQAVEPENRLVARTLEKRWEEALREQRRLEEDYDRFARERPPALTAGDRARIRALAEDIPELWRAAGTSAADRKEVVRCLVERVVVDVPAVGEHTGVAIHWHGGRVTRHEVVRPVKTYAQLRDHGRLMERLREWHAAGDTATQIAAKLNAAGFVMPRTRTGFTRGMVRILLIREGLDGGRTKAEELDPHEWRLPALAKKLRMDRKKLRGWVACGWVHARKSRCGQYWIAWADREEVNRLRALRKRSRLGVDAHPPGLTTPKRRPVG